MNHEFEIKYTTTITTEHITNVLSMESGGFDYWGEICIEQEDYEAARVRLLNKGQNSDMLCYEDVLAEILESGRALKVWDREEDKYYPLDLAVLLKGFKLFVEDACSPDDLEDLDGSCADIIMQFALFGEIIYS